MRTKGALSHLTNVDTQPGTKALVMQQEGQPRAAAPDSGTMLLGFCQTDIKPNKHQFPDLGDGKEVEEAGDLPEEGCCSSFIDVNIQNNILECYSVAVTRSHNQKQLQGRKGLHVTILELSAHIAGKTRLQLETSSVKSREE